MNTNNEQLRSKIINIIAKLDNGSHSSNQLQGVDEALTELFAAERAELIRKVESMKIKNPTGNEKGYNETIDYVLTLLRHTGEDNQNEK